MPQSTLSIDHEQKSVSTKRWLVLNLCAHWFLSLFTFQFPVYGIILLIFEKEVLVIWSSMDEPGGPCNGIRQKTERKISHDITFLWNVEGRTLNLKGKGKERGRKEKCMSKWICFQVSQETGSSGWDPAGPLCHMPVSCWDKLDFHTQGSNLKWQVGCHAWFSHSESVYQSIV